MDVVTLALAKKYTDEHSGGGVPEVTEADNGKLLMVVNGEWAAAEMADADTTSY